MENLKMTVKEMSDYLNCSESSIRKLVKENQIPYFRIYKKILFDKSLVDKWLLEKTNI